MQSLGQIHRTFSWANRLLSPGSSVYAKKATTACSASLRLLIRRMASPPGFGPSLNVPKTLVLPLHHGDAEDDSGVLYSLRRHFRLEGRWVAGSPALEMTQADRKALLSSGPPGVVLFANAVCYFVESCVPWCCMRYAEGVRLKCLWNCCPKCEASQNPHFCAMIWMGISVFASFSQAFLSRKVSR